MAVISSYLSGTSTSECLSSRSWLDVEATDNFLISQQVLSSVSPQRTWVHWDQTLTNELRSMRISYDSLSSSLFDDMKKICKFKTMAYESSASYSTANHAHGYSNLSIAPSIKKDGSTNQVGISAIATFKNDGKTTVLYAPCSPSLNAPSPYIGELKFLAQSTLAPIDEKSREFDGWVYPDGRAVSRVAFPEAFAYFGEDYGSGDGSTTFNIPSLSNLFKPISLVKSSDATADLVAKVPSNEVVLEHSHTLQNLPVNGKIKCNLKFTHVNNTDAGSACHGSIGSSKSSQKYDVQFEFSGLKFSSSTELETGIAGETGETEGTTPTYDWLPTLMYIGVSKTS